MDPSVDGRAIAAAVTLAEAEQNSADVARAAAAAAVSYHRWAMRVAAYLAFCVNEGILGPRFSLADLSEAVGLVGFEADKASCRCMHFRSLRFRCMRFSFPLVAALGLGVSEKMRHCRAVRPVLDSCWLAGFSVLGLGLRA